MAPVTRVPLVASVPDQPLAAVQEVALDEDHANVDLPPLATLLGLALKEMLGAVAATVIVADCVALPPAPVQVRMNLVVAVIDAVAFEPLVGCDPLQPPEAVQLLSSVEVQVSMDVAPLLTVAGLAVKVTEGAAAVTETVADCVAVPPLPVQVRR
jgi:hypothetical protein